MSDLDAIDHENGTALHRAVRLGDLEAATLLLDRGASVDSRFRGQTPLHLISAEKGVVGTELLKLLLSRVAAVDAKDPQGTTLGHEARCPIWYWASPGNAVTGLTLVGESFDELGVQVLGPSGRWARISRRG
jgi:Ankyrin repeats (3 copies)